MNPEVPKPELPSKLLTPWWDVCIYYTTAAMMVLSLTAIGLQTTKDHLVCLPTVNCTVYERSQSVGNENTSNDALKVCSKLKVPREERPSGTVVFTTMGDRRQYDYVDYNCYAQMSTFPKFFSLFFFGETLFLLITFNFWLKYTKTSCALSHFENLLSDFNNFEIQVYEDLANDTDNDYGCDMGELKIKVHTFNRKLLYFKSQYESEDYSHLSLNSVTLHYRIRCAFGTLLVLIFMIANISSFYSSQNLSECRLEKALFSTGNEYFECTRSIASFYDVIVWSFTGLLLLNLFFLGVTCLWAFHEVEWQPLCIIEGNQGPLTVLMKDFAFLIKLLEKSSPSFRQMSIVGNSLFLALHERHFLNIQQDEISDGDVSGESIGGVIRQL